MLASLPRPSQVAGQDHTRLFGATEHRGKEGRQATPGSVRSQASPLGSPLVPVHSPGEVCVEVTVSQRPSSHTIGTLCPVVSGEGPNPIGVGRFFYKKKTASLFPTLILAS